ncbi:MAG: adenylate/guanylate cyclase domain-containing protein [Cyanobacteria bacterium]|nr:adenylate/guanylate cyclase domain-containing protein [Cyanobacteriota bacterium]MDW8200497.1 adenylate/guanylate cyclase domain-containing protein [Cyanobacteriota bacterium SKYGB_h_bin112]
MQRPQNRRQSEPSDYVVSESSFRVKKWLNSSTIGYALIVYWGLLAAITTGQQFFYVQQWERQAQAWFTRQRGRVDPPPEIVILAIDEDSLNQGEIYAAHPEKYPHLAPLEKWPWRRSGYAVVIDRLMAAGARAIAFDVLFTTPSVYGEADDRAFRQALERHAGRVTLAVKYDLVSTAEFSARKLDSVTPRLVTQPQSVGFINVPLEADNLVHQRSTVYYDREIAGEDLPVVPSFQEATLTAAGIKYPPAQGEGIFFYGPPGTFTSIPFWHVLDPEPWKNLYQQGAFFKNKIVLIGPTALEFQDFQPTPFSARTSGVEIHANAIATLMEGRSLREAIPHPIGQGIVVALIVAGAAAILIVLPNRPLVPLLWGIGSSGIWTMISYASFAISNTILPTAIPVMALMLGSISLFIAKATGAYLEKNRLRQTLERYVSPAIAREILSQPDDYQAQLRGRKISAAVMFCDIRGFTTLSYELPPETLVAQLNMYLSAMVDVIIAERGTIDKYIGDAIMAEFGAPVSQGAVADIMCAIRAGLGMRRALAKLRDYWRETGQIPLYNGIGLNYGEVVSGNIGSIKRVEYTVIGDTVNTASRVEGLTKELGTDFLITDEVYDRVKDQIQVEYMGQQMIRGRGTVKLYSVIGLKGESTALYHQVRAELEQAKEDLKQRLARVTSQTPVSKSSPAT